jgi:glycosyltransferase involved in cell wall biosynthesis
MSAKLSVLIDTYNHEKYIRDAIKSVLTQDKCDAAAVEIVLIDDGSTDRTGEIAKEFCGVVRYYRKPNGGQASAFNFGIPLCEGEIICFLDGDDWWHPSKLSTVLDTFIKKPNLSALGHGFLEVDEVGGRSFRNGPSAPVPIKFSSPDCIDVFHKLSCCLGTSRLAIRRSVALNLLPIPEALVFEADEYMFTLLPTVGDVVVLPEVLTYYRIHGANLYQDSRAQAMKYTKDPRLVRRASIYKCLSKQLPVELRARGCSLPTIDLLLRPIRLQESRLRLMTLGGSSLENFRSEWHAAELSERNTFVRKAVLCLSLALALVCPPKLYFRVREMYSNLLRRVRGHGA